MRDTDLEMLDAEFSVILTDPQTISLLQQYSQYVSQVESVNGSLDEFAEGLVIGCLDENPAFRQWCRASRH
ncbi:MAG: hypothetical protein ACRES5_17260 [Pseudomonas sp.]|uniref:hypothetical protein n=1 Tax=Stenotrophomonas sp. TaxID=69392 RepID=UPI003D6CEAD4